MQVFTEEQLRVIGHGEGHAIINAVAGSGKTSTMVEFMARKIEKGVNPARILAVMFNVQARLDFERKLSERVRNSPLPRIRTFNSLGDHLYRNLVQTGQLPDHKLVPSQKIIERLAKPALASSWTDQHGAGARPSKDDFGEFLRFITLVKADVVSPAEVFKRRSFKDDYACMIPAYEAFEDSRNERQIRFFDDQLAMPIRLLIDHPDRWSNIIPKFDLIVVDEFQDVSPVQYAALAGVAGSTSQVVAVGDDDQSIYAFRGAIAGRLKDVFVTSFESPKEYALTKTFRFGHEVACFASHIISKNLNRFDKITVAHERNGPTPVTLVAQAEGGPCGVVSIVGPLKDKQQLHAATLLVRYKSQAMLPMLELLEAEIPFHMPGGFEPLDVPAIAALTGVLCLAANQMPDEQEAQVKILRGLLIAPPLFLKRPELEDLVDGWLDAISKGRRLNTMALRKLTDDQDRFNASSRQSILKRADAIDMVASGVLSSQSPEQLLKVYMALTDFVESVERTSSTVSEAKETVAFVKSFVEMAAREPDLAQMIDRLDLFIMGLPDDPPPFDHLSIRTIHSVKGAEFPVVILGAWGSGAFPRDHENIEEERRLAYVATTRAKSHLYVLHPADAELEKVASDSASSRDPLAPRHASPFLFDGMPGLAREMAKAAQHGVGEANFEIVVPEAKTARRYAAEAGINVKVVERAARAFRGKLDAPLLDCPF